MNKKPDQVEEVDAKSGTRVKGMTSVLGLSRSEEHTSELQSHV